MRWENPNTHSNERRIESKHKHERKTYAHTQRERERERERKEVKKEREREEGRKKKGYYKTYLAHLSPNPVEGVIVSIFYHYFLNVASLHDP